MKTLQECRKVSDYYRKKISGNKSVVVPVRIMNIQDLFSFSLCIGKWLQPINMIPQNLTTRKAHLKVVHPLFFKRPPFYYETRNTIPFRAFTEPMVIGTVTESLELHCCSRTYMGRSDTKAGSTKPVVNPGNSVPWNLFIHQKSFALFSFLKNTHRNSQKIS